MKRKDYIWFVSMTAISSVTFTYGFGFELCLMMSLTVISAAAIIGGLIR